MGLARGKYCASILLEVYPFVDLAKQQAAAALLKLRHVHLNMLWQVGPCSEIGRAHLLSKVSGIVGLCARHILVHQKRSAVLGLGHADRFHVVLVASGLQQDVSSQKFIFVDVPVVVLPTNSFFASVGGFCF